MTLLAAQSPFAKLRFLVEQDVNSVDKQFKILDKAMMQKSLDKIHQRYPFLRQQTMTLNSENLKRLERLSNIKINQNDGQSSSESENSQFSQNDDEFLNCDMDIDEDVNEELEAKMGNRQSISESSASGSFRKKNRMGNLKQ